MGNGLLLGGGPLGIGGTPHAKLSRERKHRMRDLATRKLSRAYHIDEIAASVATMQSASSIEEVARLVLQRNPSDVDAKYVEFFHEKIPSRTLAESTSLQCLDEIIRVRPADAPLLRTRAVTKIFKEDLLGAAADLTEALAIARSTETQHKPSQGQMNMLAVLGDTRELDSVRQTSTSSDAREDGHPSSLKPQLLFQRAGIYLTLACQSIGSYLDSLKTATSLTSVTESPASTVQPQKGHFPPETRPQSLEARKTTKSYAKRALRDYLSFLSFLDYTPGVPAEDRVEQSEPYLREAASDHGALATNPMAGGLETLDRCAPPEGARCHTFILSELEAAGSQNGHAVSRSRGHPAPMKVLPISDLFAAALPAAIPPYPVASEQVMKVVGSRDYPNRATVTQAAGAQQEAITFHPLLVESLHSLLLCHSLAQTSPKEHLRHAHMVARLTRLCNGYPIFLAARSPSRSDWIEVIRRADNWIGLEQSWESLCAPSAQSSESNEHQEDQFDADARERIRQEAIIESLTDERVYDDATFQAAVASRERRAETIQENSRLSEQNDQTTKRLIQENKRDFPTCSDRAEAIAMWVREAPAGFPGSNKSKRRRKKQGLSSGISLSAIEAGF
ncbi:MAG: hypothetical protein LQ346_002359 [Caloplaca aetnensis]|nr:MAG: hypothetical protein LQ346_002359 [Caloplaca aetnensis]